MPRRFPRLILCVLLALLALFGWSFPLSADDAVPGEAGVTAPVFPEQDLEGDAQYPAGAGEADGMPAGILSSEQASLDAYLQAATAVPVPRPDHYWTAGSNFRPRHSTTKMNHSGGGCVYRSNSSGEPDRDAFTAPIDLPDGAVILGLRFYGYDDSANTNSHLHIFSYYGDGNFANELTNASNGTPGAFDQYVALARPITVRNNDRALSLVWYSNAANSTLRLCGAQLLYVPPSLSPASASEQAAASTVAQDGPRDAEAANAGGAYLFLAGQDFHPHNSTQSYTYAGGGCMASANGGVFTSDANLPTGASLLGARLFYYSTRKTGLTMTVITYDGRGGMQDKLTLRSETANGEYGSVYQALQAPHIIDQHSSSMVAEVTLPSNPAVRLCGVSLMYSLPGLNGMQASGIAPAAGLDSQEAMAPSAPDEADTIGPLSTTSTDDRYRFIAGSAFQSRSASTAIAYDRYGCTHVSGVTSDLSAALHLPRGARLLGVQMFYFDTSAADSTMSVADYDGSGAFIESIVGGSSGRGGYGQRYYTPAAPYFVDTTRGLSLVWDSNGIKDGSMQLCGMRVFYSVGLARPLFMPLVYY